MSKSFSDWLHEGENLFEAGLAECQAIDERIAHLKRQRADRWATLERAARLLGRTVAGGVGRGGEAARPVAVATTLAGRGAGV